LLVPPNKQYGLGEANKNTDLVNPLCPPSSKILGNILTQHPLCFALTGFASVPWIYIQQVWHTLRLDDSKEMFIFFTNTKEFTFSVDDFRRVFQLPQATDINHAGFVEPPTFTVMLPFFLNELGYATRIHLAGQFATKDLSQLWQTLKKIFSRCLTTRVADIDQLAFQIMQMLYCFINNVHVNYVALIWECFNTIILLLNTRLSQKRIPNRDPETPTPKPAKIDVTNVDKATQMSIATARSLKDLEARQNVKRVEEHIIDEEIGKINEESAADALRRKKGKGIEDIKDTPTTTTPRSPRTHTDSLSSNKEELKELTAFEPSSFSPKPKTDCFKHYKSVSEKMSRRYDYVFRHLKQSSMPRKDFNAILILVHATLR
ncbi:hypothetical protein Tco_0850767, partial [Tanacetum coccineum]